jgi:hypothetical protein
MNRDKGDGRENLETQSIAYLSLTPGVAFNIVDKFRILCGIRILNNCSVEKSDSEYYFFPTFQMEWSL